MYDPMLSWQLALEWQADGDWHSLMLLQVIPSPVYPGLQAQLCDPSWLLQVAFVWHGMASHSLIS
jgi:hypothetical protein